jgi:nitrogen fixation protein FixH
MSAATRWMIAIVVMLAGNIAAMVILATVASATSPDIVPDYYDRAARYDDAIDEAARSRALGWSVDVRLARASIEVNLREQGGAPLEGAVVRVSGYPRAHATRTLEATLVATGPGTYRAALPATATGVHDLTIVVERRGERFSAPATVEAR